LECFRSNVTCGVDCSDDSPMDRGEVCRALEGRGDTSPPELLLWVDWVEMVSLGVVDTTTLHEGLHSGEMVVVFLGLPSAPTPRGWMRSGESARLSSGEPGSADLGRLKEDFLAADPGVKLAPGLYV